MSDETNFDQYETLPQNLIGTSKQVQKFAGRYLDPASMKFDWTNFKKAIDNYPGDDLTFDMYKNTTINQSTATVDLMVSKIVDFLKQALKVLIDATELRATIEATFLNLKQSSEKGWANFSKSNESHNSSFTYRVLFAFPNPKLPSDFYSLVTTVKLTADIKEESGWWGLTGSTSKNFAAVIDGLELVVTEGFKAPPLT
ncbi:delta-endotoxin CytB [Ceratobasidium sp. AG-I]|nr:delta-endotoxin CytB [Ceratobasidium sp. AG-I]